MLRTATIKFLELCACSVRIKDCHVHPQIEHVQLQQYRITTVCRTKKSVGFKLVVALEQVALRRLYKNNNYPLAHMHSKGYSSHLVRRSFVLLVPEGAQSAFVALKFIHG